MIRFIKRMWRDLTWKKRACPTCINNDCVSNYSPCYTCYKGSNYDERRFNGTSKDH